MKRTFWACLLLIVTTAPVNVYSAQSTMAAWGCAPVGERRNVLYLMDEGRRSYIKFSGQRIATNFASKENKRTWSWGANAVTLGADNFAHYDENGVIKAKF